MLVRFVSCANVYSFGWLGELHNDGAVFRDASHWNYLCSCESGHLECNSILQWGTCDGNYVKLFGGSG